MGDKNLDRGIGNNCMIGESKKKQSLLEKWQALNILLGDVGINCIGKYELVMEVQFLFCAVLLKGSLLMHLMTPQLNRV